MELRFGKRPVRHDSRTLRFKTYLTPELPPPPPAYDVLSNVYRKLGVGDPARLFPMDGNDACGDCTIAALAHAVTVFRGLIGESRIWSRRAVVELYFHLTGGPDSGLAALDVLNYWRTHTAAGDKILAFAAIDAAHHADIRQAMRLFGGVYLGFAVPEHCIRQFQDRVPWTPGPLTQDGHAVFAVEYDSAGLTVLTWGTIQRATWAWWDACVDEAYAILPPEARHAGFAPGFDFSQLQTDLAALAVPSYRP